MVVGEPTLMGGEFGDEDERLITRLENQQFEPNSGEGDNPAAGEGPSGPGSGGPGGGGPPGGPGPAGTDPPNNQPIPPNQFGNSPGQWGVDKKPPRPIEEPKAE